jgi:coiled-coil domain-containing protein 130
MPPDDPFGHIEKTIDQQTWAKQNTSRISELTDASDRLSSDPYVVSAALRRRFREEKKEMLEKQGRDDGLRERYGLHEEVDLGVEEVALGREMWEAGRERLGLPLDDGSLGGQGESSVRAVKGTPKYSAKGKGKGDIPDLGSLLRKTTARKYDPFSDAADAFIFGTESLIGPQRSRLKTKDPERKPETASDSKGKPHAGELAGVNPSPMGRSTVAAMTILAGYASDSSS